MKMKNLVDFQIYISVPSRITSVNVTKSAENCGFGHIYLRNPYEKLHFQICISVPLTFSACQAIS